MHLHFILISHHRANRHIVWL